MIATDQIDGATRYHVYDRKGDQSRPVRVVESTIDSTDGIEITSTPLGRRYPRGLFVAMNSRATNFALVAAELVVP